MSTPSGGQSTEEEIHSISANLNKILELFSQLTPKSSELPSLLEDSTVILEELQAVLQIVSDETQTVRTTVFSVEEQFERLESLWEKIDTAAEYVNQKKRQLVELEKLLRTRSGAGRRESLEPKQPPAKELTPIASVEEQSDDDDDAPMETTSKKLATGPDIDLVEEEEPEEKSLFEQIQEQKRVEEEKKAQKTRRIKKKKIGQGEFAVKVKKSEFKVVALDKGMKSTLEPVHNYKAELLATRTAISRIRGDPKTAAIRSKWIGK